MIQYWWQLLIFAVITYFVCNINFAVLISKALKKSDIREHGSHNPGTTNMFRVYGAKAGALTFLLDMLKGLIFSLAGTFVFRAIGGSEDGAALGNLAKYVGGFFAGLGHVFPVLYNFRGGKGFATGVGVFLVICPVYTLIAGVIGIGILLLCDRMSVFALWFFTSLLVVNAVLLLPQNYVCFIFVALYWLMVIYAHRGNIHRLLHGKENKMGLIKKKK
ncbi:MAG: glycerol-3-phosphate acyltransferase [Clostridia bacterium]|nr:glycerol-3-phosphate acyltransferase [Clostridia bacterium]